MIFQRNIQSNQFPFVCIHARKKGKEKEKEGREKRKEVGRKRGLEKIKRDVRRYDGKCGISSLKKENTFL